MKATTPVTPSDVLYGGNHAAPKPPAPGADAHPLSAAAVRVYDRKAKDGGLTIAAQQALVNREEDLAVVVGLKRPDQEALVRDVYAGAAEAGIGPLDLDGLAPRLFGAIVDREVAMARGSARPDTEPDDGREQTRREETLSALRAAFPQDDPHALLARGDRWLSKNPKLRDVIKRAGAGNDVRVVLPIVEHVRAINWRS